MEPRGDGATRELGASAEGIRVKLPLRLWRNLRRGGHALVDSVHNGRNCQYAWRTSAWAWENARVDGTKLVIGMVAGAILLVLIFQGLNQFSS